ncbi:hypothetical protein DXG01_008221 [Tephrocybe rancida]|nr:hypothetical protein DXG01_008221 [Tephrocybe rancida]
MSTPTLPEAPYDPLPQLIIATENGQEHPYTVNPGEEIATPQPTEGVEAQIRWIHFILGCCVLLPWNVMITATPYFLSRLDGSPLKGVFSSYLSVTFTASRFIFLAHATAISKQVSALIILSTSHSCIKWLIILCFLLTFGTYFRLPPGIFAAFTLAIGAAQAAIESYLQTSVVAVASLYGAQALQAMMSGQAAIAVVVSGVQVVNVALFLWKPTPKATLVKTIDGQADVNSARVFFALSTLFLVISALAHNLLVSKTTYKTFVAPLEQKFSPRTGTSEIEPLLASLSRESNTSQRHRILRVAKGNLKFEVAVAYVFVVTLAVFPPISTSVQPANPAIPPLLFNAIHFFVFNIGDFLGRFVCSIPRLIIWSANWLVTLSLARTAFIPIFLMCNIQRPSSEVPTTPVINSDLLFMLILFAFGLSNGYVSSLCMMSAPSLEHNPRLEGRREDVDVAATVANFSLVGGLALGSIASFAVMAAVCGCSPFTGTSVALIDTVS